MEANKDITKPKVRRKPDKAFRKTVWLQIYIPPDFCHPLTYRAGSRSVGGRGWHIQRMGGYCSHLFANPRDAGKFDYLRGYCGIMLWDLLLDRLDSRTIETGARWFEASCH